MRISGDEGLGVVEVVDGLLGASSTSSSATTPSEAELLPPDMRRQPTSSRELSYDNLGEFHEKYVFIH